MNAAGAPAGADEPRFVLVAGEASGDALGAGLIRALREHYYPNASFEGVTGPLMRAAGCDTLADVDELSLFGISEVVGQIPRLLRLRRRLRGHVLGRRPNAFIGIDAPAFNTALERALKQRGVITVHYVCPTAWAWRPGRAHRLRDAVDLMLAIFPFEPEFFRPYGVNVAFVGHRLADELPLHPDPASARTALGLAAGAPLVGLLPGSRVSEVSRLGPRFLATARWLRRRLPAVRFIAPMTSARVRAVFETDLRRYDLPVTVIDGRPREVMRAADALLLASGTATLEALLAKTPMVVAYQLSPSNYWLARGLDLIKVEHVSMPNLLAGSQIVPEFLQTDAEATMMGAWLYRLLQLPAARAAQIDRFEAIHATLARDADRRAAAAVAALLEARA